MYGRHSVYCVIQGIGFIRLKADVVFDKLKRENEIYKGAEHEKIYPAGCHAGDI